MRISSWITVGALVACGPALAAERPLAGLIDQTAAFTADRLREGNPYDGRHRHCAAFARYGLYLVDGRHYPTFGSARRWAQRARHLKATLPLEQLQPGDLLFFRNQRGVIDHVAIVTGRAIVGLQRFALIFQDERGTHDRIFPGDDPHLGMHAVFGADPARLDSQESAVAQPRRSRAGAGLSIPGCRLGLPSGWSRGFAAGSDPRELAPAVRP